VSPPDTQVAVLTPAGRGAVATVAVRGPQALAIVQPHFAAASQRPLTGVPAGRIQFGRFRSASGSQEEIVLLVIGPEEIELHCHGGPAAAEAIVQALVAGGAVAISWQVWIAQGEDPNRAECRVALAAATTERTCAILLDQYRGALAAELAQIDALLASADAGQQGVAHQRLERLLALARTAGSHLTTPWRIVVAGEPNVGKSSLINALLGYERSIVFHQPGTTRDALSALTAIDGWPVELIDTAGLRPTADPLEAAGIERTRAELAAADRIVLVTDVTAEGRETVPSGAILVGNKADLIDVQQCRHWQEQHPGGLLISAKTGAGVQELCRLLASRLVAVAPQSGEAVPFTPRQIGLVLRRLGQDG
jgi:tRNA modification GTPase